MREGERRTVSSGRQGGTGRRRGGREPVVAVELRHDADHAGHAAQIVAIDGRLGGAQRLVQPCDLQMDEMLGRVEPPGRDGFGHVAPHRAQRQAELRGDCLN
jgi:hypothetical protein